jgi:hypothetical protein
MLLLMFVVLICTHRDGTANKILEAREKERAKEKEKEPAKKKARRYVLCLTTFFILAD